MHFPMQTGAPEMQAPRSIDDIKGSMCHSNINLRTTYLQAQLTWLYLRNISTFKPHISKDGSAGVQRYTVRCIKQIRAWQTQVTAAADMHDNSSLQVPLTSRQDESSFRTITIPRNHDTCDTYVCRGCSNLPAMQHAQGYHSISRYDACMLC